MSCVDLFQEFKNSTNTNFSHWLSINLNNQKIKYFCRFNNNEICDNNIKNFHKVGDLINNDKKLFHHLFVYNDIHNNLEKNNTIITNTVMIAEKKSWFSSF